MSTAYAQDTQVMDFATSSESRQIREYRNLSAVRWGMSPAFPIKVRDRIVLPDHVTVIEPMTLIPFRNREYKLLKGDDKGSAPSSLSPGFVAGGEAQYEIHEKTAYACAEEIRFAYSNNNPWGFTVFNALTGIEKREVVSGILKAVAPRRMPLPELIEYLQAVSPVNIAETAWPEGQLTGSLTCAEVADSVREQLLEGALQAQTFGEMTWEETDEEIHQKAGGGKGKARADNRDKMISEALSRPVPTVRPQAVQPTAPIAPTVNPQLEQALAIFLARENEKTGEVEELKGTVERLSATVRELTKPKLGRPPTVREG